MKTNLEYYPHRKDSHRHPKFKLLRFLYGGGDKGWAAEGRFWALNNLISHSENCEYDLNKNRNMAVATEELNLSPDELNNFISILLSEDIQLLTELEPGLYTTKKVKEAFEKVSGEREKARVRKEKANKQESSANASESLTNLEDSSPELTPKVKESKIKKSETKVESKENLESPIYSLPSTLDLPLPLTTNYENFTPIDFENNQDLREKIGEVLRYFTQSPDEKTITTFFNVVAKKNQLTGQVSKQTSFKILYEVCCKWNTLELEKKNYPYLFSKFTGMIQDRLSKALEKRNKSNKLQEKKEIQNIQDPKVLETVNTISKNMTFN